MLGIYLNITDAQVRRTLSVSDGIGGMSVTTTLTTLSACAIWENGLGGRFQRITGKPARNCLIGSKTVLARRLCCVVMEKPPTRRHPSEGS